MAPTRFGKGISLSVVCDIGNHIEEVRSCAYRQTVSDALIAVGQDKKKQKEIRDEMTVNKPLSHRCEWFADTGFCSEKWRMWADLCSWNKEREVSIHWHRWFLRTLTKFLRSLSPSKFISKGKGNSSYKKRTDPTSGSRLVLRRIGSRFWKNRELLLAP